MGIAAGRAAKYRINRYDECAIEQALQIGESHPGTAIDVVSVGPDRAAGAVRRALGMGAHNGVHLRAQGGEQGPFAIAERIASYARTQEYDLILCGLVSEDLMQGLVGPLVAEHLSMPCATSVVSIRGISPGSGKIVAEREMGGRLRQVLELDMPGVLTLQSGINEPRYPSLSNMMRAHRTELRTVDSASLAQPEPRQSTLRLEYPEKSRAGVVLEGSTQQKASQLLQILRQKAVI